MGFLPFIGGLCGDFSPHRTTMTQTKCCPIFCILGCGGVPFNGSSRSHRALEGSSLPSSIVPFSVLLRRSTLALRLGGSGSWQRSEFYVFLRRYGRRSGQPSSSSLARRACVHYSGWLAVYCTTPLVLVFFKFVYWDTLKFVRAPGPFGGRGEMAMAVASSARLAFLLGAVCATTLYIRCSIELPATTVGECRRRHSL